MFIAVVTILSAVLLVMIGLTGSTAKDIKLFRLPQHFKGMFKRDKVGKTTMFQINKRKMKQIERLEEKKLKKQNKK